MLRWLFQTLPSVIFDPLFYAGLAGLLLLLTDRQQRILNRANRLLILAALLFMLCWRMLGARGSTRYSALLIPVFLLLCSIFFTRLMQAVPPRVRKLAAICGCVLLFAVCGAKILRQYDPVRLGLFRSLAGCIRQETGRVRVASDQPDHARLAWYAGVPGSLLLSREDRSLEATLKALLPLRNRDGVFYVVLQDPLNSQPLGDEMRQRPGETWEFCGEFVKNHRRKYVLRVYRFQPAPHWQKVAAPVALPEDDQPLFQENFETAAPAEAAADPRLILPPGWGINGIPSPDVRIFPETAEPLSGAGSLTVRSSIAEFLTQQYFPTAGDCVLHFLVRGSEGSSLLARVYVYPPQGGIMPVDLDRFSFEDGDLHECRIPVSFRNVPDGSRFRIAFRSYDGAVTLDALRLLPVPPAPRAEEQEPEAL